MSRVFVRNEFNYDMDEVSIETGLTCLDDSMAVQSQKDEADINVIVARFGLTGTLPQTVRLPSYGDFDVVNDYRSALEAVKNAELEFNSLPAAVRSRFDNDPQAFLEFVEDESNEAEMRELGLLPEKPVTVVPAPVNT